MKLIIANSLLFFEIKNTRSALISPKNAIVTVDSIPQCGILSTIKCHSKDLLFPMERVFRAALEQAARPAFSTVNESGVTESHNPKNA
jgi:hypothetical protein